MAYPGRGRSVSGETIQDVCPRFLRCFGLLLRSALLLCLGLYLMILGRPPAPRSSNDRLLRDGGPSIVPENLPPGPAAKLASTCCRSRDRRSSRITAIRGTLG
jgi:hypothetical protein